MLLQTQHKALGSERHAIFSGGSKKVDILRIGGGGGVLGGSKWLPGPAWVPLFQLAVSPLRWKHSYQPFIEKQANWQASGAARKVNIYIYINLYSVYSWLKLCWTCLIVMMMFMLENASNKKKTKSDEGKTLRTEILFWIWLCFILGDVS